VAVTERPPESTLHDQEVGLVDGDATRLELGELLTVEEQPAVRLTREGVRFSFEDTRGPLTLA
jgi:hypothetical protein